MKDFLGRNLYIGDSVWYLYVNDSHIYKKQAIIKKINPEKKYPIGILSEGKSKIGWTSSHKLIKNKFTFTIEDWNHTCGDGCCDSWGKDIFIEEERLEEQNENIENIVKQVIESLGYKTEQ